MTAPPGTEGIGQCMAGWHVCKADGLGFSVCAQQMLPNALESCAEYQDNDCDGFTCGGVAWAQVSIPPQAPNIADEVQVLEAGGEGTFFSVTRRGSTVSAADPYYLVRKHLPDGALVWEETLVASGASGIGGAAYDPNLGLALTGWFQGNGSGLVTAAGTALGAANATRATFRVVFDDEGNEVGASVLQTVVLGTPYATTCDVHWVGGQEVHACQSQSPSLDFANITPLGAPAGLTWNANTLTDFSAVPLPSGGYAVAGANKGALKAGAFTTLCPDTGNADWFVAHVNAALAVQWIKCFGTAVDDFGIKLAVTTAGETAVALPHTGAFVIGGSGFQADASGVNTAIVFFDATGTVVKSASVTGNGPQSPLALAPDDKGQVLGLFHTEGPGQVGGTLISAGPVLGAFSVPGPTWVRSLGTNAPGLYLGALAVTPVEPSLLVGGIGHGSFDLGGVSLVTPQVSGGGVIAKIGR